MSLIALLVEGKTEWIFFTRLLPLIQLPDKLFVSKNLIEVLENNIHENKIWLQDCSGDNSFPTYMRKNANAFLRNDFRRVIIIRDYFPANRHPTNLSKKDLCQSLLGNLPASIICKYSENVFINLSVEEVEAWFFADRNLFERLNPSLTQAYINSRYNNILTVNPETIRHPSAKLKEVIDNEIPGHTYNKTEKEAYFVISRIDMNTCLEMMDINFIQSFYRIVNYLLQIL